MLPTRYTYLGSHGSIYTVLMLTITKSWRTPYSCEVLLMLLLTKVENNAKSGSTPGISIRILMIFGGALLAWILAAGVQAVQLIVA